MKNIMKMVVAVAFFMIVGGASVEAAELPDGWSRDCEVVVEGGETVDYLGFEYKGFHYTGKEIKPEITVMYNGEVVDPSNYTVKWVDCVKAGFAHANVYGNDDELAWEYDWPGSGTFVIVDNWVQSYTVKLEKESYKYTGKAIKPKFTVYDGKKVADPSEYRVEYCDNVEPSDNYDSHYPYIRIVNKVNKDDYVRKSFKINSIPMSDCEVKLSKTSYTYEGTYAFRPSVSVSYKGKKLAKSKYTVEYEDNYEAGKASVIVSGSSKHFGDSVTKHFTIKRASIKGLLRLSATKWIYTGKRIKPTVVIKQDAMFTKKFKSCFAFKTVNSPATKYDNGLTPKNGGVLCPMADEKNLSIKYQKSVKPGKYTVTVKGIKNCKDTVKLTYKIVTKKQLRKACGKYSKKLMSKKEFQKRVKEFLSYNVYCDRADWSKRAPLNGGKQCSGYASDFGVFLGNYGAGEPIKKKSEIRAGDRLGFTDHVYWVIERRGDKLYTIEGNGSRDARVMCHLVSELKKFHYVGGVHYVKK